MLTIQSYSVVTVLNITLINQMIPKVIKEKISVAF